MLRLSRLALALLVGLLSVVLGVFSSPAAASTAQGIASNAWIVSDLAGTAMSSLPASAEVTAYEANLARSATVGTTAAAGLSTAPKTSSKLGMVLNSVAVLGGLAMLWPGGEEAPALPQPPPSENVAGNNWGWTTVQGAYAKSACGSTSSSCPWQFPAISAGYRWWTRLASDSPTGTPGTWSSPGTTSSVNLSPDRKYDKVIMTTTDTTTTAEKDAWPNLGWIITQRYGINLGSPAPAPASDPALVPRYIDSEITCKSATGGSQVLTQRTGPFTFDPEQPFTMPEAPDMVCPDGTWLSSGKRELASEGSTETVPLVEPYVPPDWVGEQVTQFPDCFPIGTALCQLELVKVAVTPELHCNRQPAAAGHPCRDWKTDPNRKDRYQCRFGASVLALWRCNPYADTYTTSVVVESPPVEPEPDVPTDDPTPEQTPKLGNCTPNWADLLTPWWVFKASACALKWAFVPEVAFSVRMGGIKTALSTVAPFNWLGGMASIPATVPEGACPDWRIKVAGTNESVVCDSSYTAAIRSMRPLLVVFMCSLALWPVIRSTAYGSIPIIRATPGKL